MRCPVSVKADHSPAIAPQLKAIGLGFKGWNYKFGFTVVPSDVRSIPQPLGGPWPRLLR